MGEHMTKEELKERIADLEWEDFEAKTAKSELPSLNAGRFPVALNRMVGKFFALNDNDCYNLMFTEKYWCPKKYLKKL